MSAFEKGPLGVRIGVYELPSSSENPHALETTRVSCQIAERCRADGRSLGQAFDGRAGGARGAIERPTGGPPWVFPCGELRSPSRLGGPSGYVRIGPRPDENKIALLAPAVAARPMFEVGRARPSVPASVSFTLPEAGITADRRPVSVLEPWRPPRADPLASDGMRGRAAPHRALRVASQCIHRLHASGLVRAVGRPGARPSPGVAARNDLLAKVCSRTSRSAWRSAAASVARLSAPCPLRST